MISLKTLAFTFLSTFAMAQPILYDFQFTTTNVDFSCTLNGFPLYEINSPNTLLNNVVGNLSLIGNHNMILLKARRIDKTKPAEISLVCVAGNKNPIFNKDFSISDSLNDRITFDNEQTNFSDLFINSDPIDKEQVQLYAKRLLHLGMTGNIMELQKEFLPKVRAYSEAFNAPADVLTNQMGEHLQAFLPLPPSSKDDSLTATPFCENRIWRINLSDREFFYRKNGDATYKLPIYVAKVNGTLKVVR